MEFRLAPRLPDITGRILDESSSTGGSIGNAIRLSLRTIALRNEPNCDERRLSSFTRPLLWSTSPDDALCNG